ncbi:MULTISPECIES: response regulator transcription factor [unclassified Paenibacillus]|uniref:response regulator transcription factor n=1 Tax=unclassified Paenibacillus TaxID=185978 RepID=UPI003625E3CB
MNDAKLLLVDDEPSILRMLQTVLAKEGFTHVDTETSAEGALAACRSKTYDFILLDVMLPGQSGFDICPFIRATTDAPIFFITARTTDFDKLTGFAVGGDDYIVKPFNPLEVVARIKAHLRRYQRQASSVLSASVIYDFGRFQVDESAGELRVEGVPLDCPAQVFQLLLFLCKNPNRMFSKKTLYERVWGQDSLSDDNTVMVHIHRIRERIERNPSEPELLLTVRGLGYKLVRRGDAREP